MARTVVIKAFGGPEVLELEDRPVGDPGPGQVRIRHHAVGLNFIDVYQRTGVYPLQLPCALGMEAAGVIEAVGEGVTHLKPGDRAAYAAQPPGSYTEARVMPAAQVCPLPDAISFEEGAAMMLKGLTVQYLFHRTVPLKAGDTVLFHAAAGGVGLIACQWAKSEGIRLIATAGSDEKCQMALDHGADAAINYRDGAFAPKVRELTGGRGVDVVFENVGAAVWGSALKSLVRGGRIVTCGATSGDQPGADLRRVFIRQLQIFGSTLGDPSELRELLNWCAGGRIRPVIDSHFTMDRIHDALDRLEAGAQFGKLAIEVAEA